MKVRMIKASYLDKLVAHDRKWTAFADAVRKTDSRFSDVTQEWLEPEGCVVLIDDYDMFKDLLDTEGYAWDIHRIVGQEKILYLWKPLNNSGGTSYYIRCRGMRDLMKRIKDA